MMVTTVWNKLYTRTIYEPNTSRGWSVNGL